MSEHNWVQNLRNESEYQRKQKEKYMAAMVTAVSMLFDLGHPDKGKEIMKMAGLPIGEKKEGCVNERV